MIFCALLASSRRSRIWLHSMRELPHQLVSMKTTCLIAVYRLKGSKKYGRCCVVLAGEIATRLQYFAATTTHNFSLWNIKHKGEQMKCWNVNEKLFEFTMKVSSSYKYHFSYEYAMISFPLLVLFDDSSTGKTTCVAARHELVSALAGTYYKISTLTTMLNIKSSAKLTKIS